MWDFNATQLQGLTSLVCGQYCCLFALYLDQGYSPKQFISLFDPRTVDKEVARFSHQNSGLAAKQGDLEVVSVALVTKEASSVYGDEKKK